MAQGKQGYYDVRHTAYALLIGIVIGSTSALYVRGKLVGGIERKLGYIANQLLEQNSIYERIAISCFDNNYRGKSSNSKALPKAHRNLAQ